MVLLFMSWDEKSIQILKENWGRKTASQIAVMLPGKSRNSIIGKCYRLGLSNNAFPKKSSIHKKINSEEKNEPKVNKRVAARNKFRSLIIDKNFEPAQNLTLEELNDENCRYMELHPTDPNASFCGRKAIKGFSYCPLHIMVVYTPRNKKEDIGDKSDEVPQFIKKKIKSAS